MSDTVPAVRSPAREKGILVKKQHNMAQTVSDELPRLNAMGNFHPVTAVETLGFPVHVMRNWMAMERRGFRVLSGPDYKRRSKILD